MNDLQLEPWQQELQRCIRTIEQLERYIPIRNRKRMRNVLANMRLSITPHTPGLIDFDDPKDPILLMSVPQEHELIFSREELADPIGDDTKSAVPFLVHRYPDRVLVHATFFCSQFCRFCFRRSKTGEANPGPGRNDVDRIIRYLVDHQEIEEVILSGGDPFMLQDWQIEEWIRRIREIPSIRRIRFHTRALVTIPSRITDHLVDILRKFMDSTHPIYIVTHFNHPREMTSANISAIAGRSDKKLSWRCRRVKYQRGDSI